MANYNLLKLLSLVCVVFMLNACSSGARMNAMTVSVTPETMITEENKLFQAIKIDGVSGGKETNPLWTSEVGDVEFEQALLNTLKAHAMISIGDAKYKLTAILEEVKQPLIGFSLTVKSRVKYILVNNSNQEVVYEEIINNEYTAAFGDSFLAVKRLQLANEGAIRENISTFVSNVIKSSKTGDIASHRS